MSWNNPPPQGGRVPAYGGQGGGYGGGVQGYGGGAQGYGVGAQGYGGGGVQGVGGVQGYGGGGVQGYGGAGVQGYGGAAGGHVSGGRGGSYGGAPGGYGGAGGSYGGGGRGGYPPTHQQYPPAVPPAYAQPKPPPPGIDPTLWGWFQTVDVDNSGTITADELQQALLNNNWSHFNGETCRLMIGMFDKDRSGTIDVYEFTALWKYIQQWKGCFDRFDLDKSGTIDNNELHQAFTTFGYRLTPEFCRLCVRVFDRTSLNSMKFDDFIQCCVMLKTLTDSFRKHDHQQRGVIQINYEQFLEMVLDNTLSGK